MKREQFYFMSRNKSFYYACIVNFSLSTWGWRLGELSPPFTFSRLWECHRPHVEPHSDFFALLGAYLGKSRNLCVCVWMLGPALFIIQNKELAIVTWSFQVNVILSCGSSYIRIVYFTFAKYRVLVKPRNSRMLPLGFFLGAGLSPWHLFYSIDGIACWKVGCDALSPQTSGIEYATLHKCKNSTVKGSEDGVWNCVFQ